MLRAEKDLGGIGVGVTKPRLMEGNDGRIYVVKLKNNRLGVKVLANEYIASRFGKWANLCFPAGEPIEITEEFAKKLQRNKKLRVKSGLHFASAYLKKAHYVHRYNLSLIKNKEEIAGVMLFDHLMYNDDRTLNGKNMLIQKEQDGYRFSAIDHSHLFGSGRWKAANLAVKAEEKKVNQHRAYGTLLRHYLREEDFSPYIARFKAISPEQIAEMVDDIPGEWLSDETERALLKEFLQRRCEAVEVISAQIMQMIPAR